MSKPDIEAIYPLSYMQQVLLFHHIHEDPDQGFVQVECSMTGKLDLQLLEEAIAKTVQRHQALRTSIHWEKIKKPVQIVHPIAPIRFTVNDWRPYTAGQQAEKLKSLKASDHANGLDLTVAAVSTFTLIHQHDEQYLLLWNCHHIVLDGWSAAIILKDVFHYYDHLSKATRADLATLPDYRSYLNWLQQQDITAAGNYWKQVLEGFEVPSLLASAPGGDPSSSKFSEKTLSLSPGLTSSLMAYAKQKHLTLSTIIQGSWAILLGNILHRNDVAFGVTVSGRSAAIPNFELVAGLFMNVLPARITLTENSAFSDWLVDLQRQQMESRKFEYVTLDQIQASTNWSGHLPLFDSLLVIENFPWSEVRAGEVIVDNLHGDFTSTYPVTLVVKPGAQVEFVFRYQTSKIPENLITFLSSGLNSIIESIVLPSDNKLSDLSKILETPAGLTKNTHRNGHDRKPALQKNDHISPRNSIELKLTGIWEEIFGLHPIGVRDDFFQLGGTSLQAVRLFAQIEKKLGRSVSPVSLLQNRTIESLALLMTDDQVQTWESLVPIRAGGSRSPLFCVHAGGAHVLFYHAMARHLGSNQPVYALQPRGLDGLADRHKTVEEMASYYVAEIRKVQPEGPYAILGTCFGNAVCLEMARQLQAAKQSISLLAIIDSGVYSQQEMSRPTPTENLKRIPVRYERFLKRFKKNAGKAIMGIFLARMTRLRIMLEKRFNFLRSRQTQSLYSIQKHLLHLHLQYTWAPYDGKVTLIRSSESTQNPNLDCHITQWSKLAKGGLDVYVVPGHHETLFEEPEVQILASELKKCLYKNQDAEIIVNEVA